MHKSDIEKLDSGDTEALEASIEAIIQAYLPQIRHMVASRLGPSNESNIDDLTQEILITLVESIRKLSFQGRGSLGAYCAAIANHKIRDFLKVRNAKKRLALKLDEFPFDELDTEYQASDMFNKKSLLDNLIQLLPKRQKEVVEARLEGLSYKDIARKLGSTPSKVRHTNLQAIEALRNLYTKEYRIDLDERE